MKKANVLILIVGLPILLLLTASNTIDPLSPSPRGYHQMAYDSKLNSIILFGGQTGNIFEDPAAFNAETWMFNPDTGLWIEKLSTDSPGSPTNVSTGGDMTYNSKADRTILSILTNDLWNGTLETWVYDSTKNTWEKMADGPGKLTGQRLAYRL